MLSITERDLRLAWSDMRQGLAAWNIWHILAMQELRQRYRRSVLGPLWICVSLAVQVAVMGFLVGVMFKQEFTKYLPYATLGIILWNFNSVGPCAWQILSHARSYNAPRRIMLNGASRNTGNASSSGGVAAIAAETSCTNTGA